MEEEKIDEARKFFSSELNKQLYMFLTDNSEAASGKLLKALGMKAVGAVTSQVLSFVGGYVVNMLVQSIIQMIVGEKEDDFSRLYNMIKKEIEALGLDLKMHQDTINLSEKEALISASISALFKIELPTREEFEEVWKNKVLECFCKTYRYKLLNESTPVEIEKEKQVLLKEKLSKKLMLLYEENVSTNQRIIHLQNWTSSLIDEICNFERMYGLFGIPNQYATKNSHTQAIMTLLLACAYSADNKKGVLKEKTDDLTKSISGYMACFFGKDFNAQGNHSSKKDNNQVLCVPTKLEFGNILTTLIKHYDQSVSNHIKNTGHPNEYDVDTYVEKLHYLEIVFFKHYFYWMNLLICMNVVLGDQQTVKEYDESISIASSNFSSCLVSNNEFIKLCIKLHALGNQSSNSKGDSPESLELHIISKQHAGLTLYSSNKKYIYCSNGHKDKDNASTWYFKRSIYDSKPNVPIFN